MEVSDTVTPVTGTEMLGVPLRSRAILINQLNLCHVWIGTGEGYVIASCRIAIEGKWCGESARNNTVGWALTLKVVLLSDPNGIKILNLQVG